MKPVPYSELSDLELLELATWREARGESAEGKRGVAHVIRNRTRVRSWWNKRILHSYSHVILEPYQFSSFNRGDINHDKWPADYDPDFAECSAIATLVHMGSDPDNTNGATHYHDQSIGWPDHWGPEQDWINTINIGRLMFFKAQSVILSVSHEQGTDTNPG